MGTSQKFRAPTQDAKRIDKPRGERSPHRSSFDESERSLWEKLALSSSTGVGHALIVDDDSAVVQSGQLRKSEFLVQAENTVCEAVNEVLRPAGQSTEGCPYLIALFPRLRRRNAGALNAIVARYGAASSAGELLAIISQRARQSAQAWLVTGDLRDVPELSAALGEESFQAKVMDGAAPPSPDNPAAIRESLGRGSVLDGAARGTMESAFGESLSDVRIHQDSRADSLAARYGALAFTVGNHIAFSHGAFAPGTPQGDALLAHELAHVRQQRGALHGNHRGSRIESRGFESEADGVAARVLGRIYGKSGSAPLRATPGGLALRRCKDKKPAPAPLREDSKALQHGVMKWRFTPDDGLIKAEFEFQPNEAMKQHAQHIAFIQTLTVTDARGEPNFADFGGGPSFAGKENVRVDFTATEDLPPYYGRAWSQSDPNTPASMSDEPRGYRKEFETVAVVVETGQVLGSFHWGVDYTGSGSGGPQLLFAQKSDCKDEASPKFEPAVERFFANRYEETLDRFAQNSAVLTEDHRKALDRVANVLKGNPEKLAILAGTADLSEIQPEVIAGARTQAVKNYLKTAGIAEDRIKTLVNDNYGSQWARVKTSSGASEPANRRVHIVIGIKPGKDVELTLPKR